MIWTCREAPNIKLQTPENNQIPNAKLFMGDCLKLWLLQLHGFWILEFEVLFRICA